MKIFAPILLVCAFAFSGFTFEAPVHTDDSSSIVTSCESAAAAVYLATVQNELSRFLPRIRAASGLRSTKRITVVFTNSLKRAMSVYKQDLNAC